MDFFIGEIKMVAFDFAPRDWASCDGQIVKIRENATFYAVIGDRFGGDGNSTMAFPNLKGRVPLGEGYGNYLGFPGGLEKVPLDNTNIPTHTHNLMANNNPASTKTENPEGAILANSDNNAFKTFDETNAVNLKADTLTVAGDSIGHSNVQPSLALNFIICTDGIFPSRN